MVRIRKSGEITQCNGKIAGHPIHDQGDSFSGSGLFVGIFDALETRGKICKVHENYFQTYGFAVAVHVFL